MIIVCPAIESAFTAVLLALLPPRIVWMVCMKVRGELTVAYTWTKRNSSGEAGLAVQVVESGVLGVAV